MVCVPLGTSVRDVCVWVFKAIISEAISENTNRRLPSVFCVVNLQQPERSSPAFETCAHCPDRCSLRCRFLPPQAPCRLRCNFACTAIAAQRHCTHSRRSGRRQQTCRRSASTLLLRLSALPTAMRKNCAPLRNPSASVAHFAGLLIFEGGTSASRTHAQVEHDNDSLLHVAFRSTLFGLKIELMELNTMDAWKLRTNANDKTARAMQHS